jgi:glyoxylate reductase
MKVFITGDLPGNAVDLLLKNKIEVVVFDKDRALTKEEFVKYAKDADGVISLLRDKIDSEIIDSMPNCKVIANYAVGFNNIDVAYAKKKKIVVVNTPDVLTDSTADIAMSLVLACARRIPEGEKIVRNKKFKGWGPKLLLGYELRNKNFGILGAGRIGAATALRAKAFGCNILYYSNHQNLKLEKATGAIKMPLKTLIKNSDVISIHLPLTAKTNNLLNEGILKLLKPSAILINTARGEVVDEKVLIQMLKEKKIFSAGFDVYQNEPNINPELFKLDNVVLLPHIGSATVEARTEMADLSAKNVIAVLSGKKAITPVN